MEDFIMIAQTFLTGGWKMMYQTEIPGLGISVAGFSLALLLIGFSIRIIGYLTGFRMGSYGAAANAADKAKSTYSKLKSKSGK